MGLARTFSLALAALSACAVTAACSGILGIHDPEIDGLTGNEAGPSAGDGSAMMGSESGASETGGNTDAAKDAKSTAGVDAPTDLMKTCPVYTSCGGAPEGTYDFTHGCVPALAMPTCNGIDNTNLRGIVNGSYTFASGKLTRDARFTISGSFIAPQSCTGGMCSFFEVQESPKWDAISCTGASTCTCNVKKELIAKNNTTFTLNADALTTGDGETWQICSLANELRYNGPSFGIESNTFQLVPRN